MHKRSKIILILGIFFYEDTKCENIERERRNKNIINI